MIISVINLTKRIKDARVQEVIRAVNRQIADDFEPYWSFGATLRLEGSAGRIPVQESPSEMRGDAILYLWDDVDTQDALGYHDANAKGIPYGFVFMELSRQLGENWTVTLSHEALELVGDAQSNLLAQGPHPAEAEREVFHWFEMCDAVQDQTYVIDGVEVANFVLPLYFTPGEQEGGRNDFLGTLKRGKALSSFGVAAGGYVGFYDPVTRQHEQYFVPGDNVAKKRLQVKAAAKSGRGFVRKNTLAMGARKGAHLRALDGWIRERESATASDDPIKHVVVLMLENRSFDHMLGGMSRWNEKVDGVVRAGTANFNLDKNGGKYEQQPGAKDVIMNRKDLDHEHDGTEEEMGSASAPMSGFIKRFALRYPDATTEELQQVMDYFEFGATPAEDTLPALHKLARHFTVCDHWFSSMPGPTWPNRFFAHSGTCLGHVLMPSKDEPQNMRLYYQETIYDRLDKAGVRWKIYHDGVPQSIVMTSLLTRYMTWRGYASMEKFFEQAQGVARDFPEYAFIEPCYFGAAENDQHPPADVRDGETLIANVYNALRSNEDLWQSTLLVVLYDEHGGFYDHLPPPTTVAPDLHTTEYAFNRLGVRVPAILVSPWVERDVINAVFDHTSLLRYLCEKWKLEPLGERMQLGAGAFQARSIGEFVTRATPRDDHDTPKEIKLRVVKKKRSMSKPVIPSISGSRESLLMFVEQLPGVATEPKIARRGRVASAARRSKAVAPSADAATRIDAALQKLQTLRGRLPPAPPESIATK
jgi:phospholipase C